MILSSVDQSVGSVGVIDGIRIDIYSIVRGAQMTEGEIAEIRERYRPELIKVLFVGEAPPISGRFFYRGNNRLLDHMRDVLEERGKDDDAFLESFRERGWYLDDLVTAPITDIRKRRAKCLKARDSLAERIIKYNPLAIVCLLRGIGDDVEIAAHRAGSKLRPYVVPFAGHSHQGEFKEEMRRILPSLLAL
jgi:hypothetical protein